MRLMKHMSDSTDIKLSFASEWTVFGPCSDADPLPSPADLIACPAALRLGGKELAAHRVRVSVNGINLGELLGGHRERLGAWVYIPVTAPRTGRFRVGLGADWWLEAFLDGKPLKSTLETGNGQHPPRRTDHAAEADLAAGAHILAVRVLSGSNGWTFDAGPQLAHSFRHSPLQAFPPLWDPAHDVPRHAVLPQVEGAEFHVIKKQRPDTDGCTFTLGVGLAWHKDRLYASYGFNQGPENTATEEAHVRVSEDGGKTWGATVVMDAGAGNLGVSHGVFLSHEGRLWAFMGAFYDNFQRTHTRAYTLNESSGQWDPHGVVISAGFWPMQEPQRMTDGNWIMSGIRVEGACGQDGANLPAMAVKRGHGDAGFDDTAILSRMLGKLAFDGDIASWSPELTRRARHWADVFKSLRHLMVQDFHQLTPAPTTADDWDVMSFNAYDGSEAALYAFSGRKAGSRSIPLRGLAADKTYRIECRNDGVRLEQTGAELMRAGLGIELNVNSAKLWHLKEGM